MEMVCEKDSKEEAMGRAKKIKRSRVKSQKIQRRGVLGLNEHGLLPECWEVFGTDKYGENSTLCIPQKRKPTLVPKRKTKEVLVSKLRNKYGMAQPADIGMNN
jgi:hypothetical protein